ncbi:MAG: glycosyltransferase family 2 protein [Methylobacter sp.]|jgi:rhamnosyltransferase|uniref:glycosyltransferase family 2 protein n=1 Tax=Methylobacter sp. TaxID=2051955 RepID=UPI0025E1202E|nr:glycosyltransferase family 2 protein [Methylobacter sp.]MCK9621476.1 glycosyltransferase family 2 protein [Methylobacter sp.]
MLKNNYCDNVSAVLVTYNPNMEALHAAIRAVSEQVSDVFIVDNASSNFSLGWIDPFKGQANAKLHLLRQEENLGIGAAHNIGIRHAIEQGSKFVLLLDQDSQVGLDMVVRLRSAYALLDEKGFQVAALGPQYRDADNGMLSRFVKVGMFRFVHCGCEDNASPIDADFLVSSGSLFPVAALEAVGLMDESLFIDHVDTEWCFRAKSKGLKIFGLCGAVMTHALGEQRKEIWFLRKRTVPFHKPFRYYYMFRNSVLLYRRRYMPWRWKFVDIIRCLKMMIFFSWAAENRLTCLKMMCLGVIDGLKGINGIRNGL